jgi:16S rRNA (cytosine967-C5)-methyltransferase
VRQLREEEVQVLPHERVPLAFRVLPATTANLRATQSFRHGDFEIQDISSQATSLLCRPQPGQQWWDACAGGGGKTLHLAWLMQGKGSVLATDIRLHKLEELRLRARRAQFPNIRYKEWKGKPMPTFRGRFDGVLVDAPCSCSGTWRRNPGGRWTTTEEDVQDCAQLQRQLLENAAPAVKPGGLLVYSTCSMFPAENQDVVRDFLAAHPEFSLEPDCNPLTGVPTDGTCLILHQDGDGDAMFTARLRRQGAKTATVQSSTLKTHK